VPDTAALAVAIRYGLLPGHLRHVSVSGAHPHVAVLTRDPDKEAKMGMKGM